MDIAGPLLEGVLEQPVDDIDDMGVVGVRLLVAGAEIEQLLEIARVVASLVSRLAPLTDLARRKNSTAKRWMSVGLATTRRIGSFST